MAILQGTDSDLGRHRMTHAFTADGTSPWTNAEGLIWLAVWDTFTGAALTWEVSFDGGTTAIPLAANTAGAPLTVSAPLALVVSLPEQGLLIRARCTGILSGTARIRISGGFR